MAEQDVLDKLEDVLEKIGEVEDKIGEVEDKIGEVETAVNADRVVYHSCSSCNAAGQIGGDTPSCSDCNGVGFRVHGKTSKVE